MSMEKCDFKNMPYISFGDRGVVRNLILSRSKIDIDEENNENIICYYTTLDSLILSASLTNIQKEILKYIMQGYSMSEISNLYSKPIQEINVQFTRTVDKIIDANKQKFKEMVKSKYGINVKDF